MNVLNAKVVNPMNDGSNLVCISCVKDVFMISHDKSVARYALSVNSRVKELMRSFGKHLEEKNVTCAKFGKKLDKNTTLQARNFHSDAFTKSALKVKLLIKIVTPQSIETTLGFAMKPSRVKSDCVTTTCDAITMTDKEKHLADMAG
ncbi:hypothetical protein Tco_0844922 [Tanacetum coccineum]